MSAGKFIEDAPGPWLVCNGAGVHIALSGAFGGGTVAIEQQVNGVTSPALDETPAPIAFTAAADVLLDLRPGDVFRLTLSGSTAPGIDWQANETRYKDWPGFAP